MQSRRAISFGAALLLALLAGRVDAAPTAELHELKWFVHVDMVAGGMDLPFYEDLIDEALDNTRIAMEGNQGPADDVCCSQFVKEEHSPSVTLATFGTTGDGLEVVDTGDYEAIELLGGSGSRAFLVDSINDCNGGTAVGCADIPLCDTTADDDPDLILIVTMEAQDAGVLGLVIAHERGHNACLEHVFANNCELMRGTVNGACLSPSECAEYGFARTTTGGSCVCHASAGNEEPDGTACVDGAITGACSGGVCGDTPGDASVQLMASGGPESATGATTDDPLLTSSIPGGWSDLGAFGGTVTGLAYDPDTGTLYGVEDTGGTDALVILDPTTGAITSTVGAITGETEVFSLAFDPGPTVGSGDDRLLATADGSPTDDLLEIDPANASPTQLGSLNFEGDFVGLAYDSVDDQLYAAGFSEGSLWEIDVSACTGESFSCSMTEVQAVDLPRKDPSLAYSPASGNLYLVGGQGVLGDRILYNSIDRTTFAVTPTMGLDPYTVGALAAIPVPEPSMLTGSSASGILLALLARRRRRARGA